MHTLQELQTNDTLIVAPADEKLGLVLIEKKKYIKLAFKNHLSDKNLPMS